DMTFGFELPEQLTTDEIQDDIYLCASSGPTVVSHGPERGVVAGMHAELGRVFQEDSTEGQLPVLPSGGCGGHCSLLQYGLEKIDGRWLHPLMKRLSGQGLRLALPEAAGHLAE
ncbi:MAG: hypothetical protein ABI600_07240, partial [Luteolibacter sp.]